MGGVGKLVWGCQQVLAVIVQAGVFCLRLGFDSRAPSDVREFFNFVDCALLVAVDDRLVKDASEGFEVLVWDIVQIKLAFVVNNRFVGCASNGNVSCHIIFIYNDSL